VAGRGPPNPAIYHITHVANLVSIVGHGCLFSDSERIARGLQPQNIGYTHIKQRRLRRSVPVAAQGMLGDYVPFNFCNRSVMLYALRAGHQDYAGTQDEIVHLVSSVQTAVSANRPWAFTDRHAELGYTQYFESLSELSEVDWTVMPLVYWSNTDDTKEKRQAEFLVHKSFPWSAIERIGVHDQTIAAKVQAALGRDTLPIEIQPSWYY